MKKYLVVLLSAIMVFCLSSNAIAKKDGKEGKGRGGEFKAEKLEKIQDVNSVKESSAGKLKDKQKKAKKVKGTAEDKVKDANDIVKGEGHKQQLKAVEDKLARETEKHNTKLARLEKNKQAAIDANDTDKLAKIEQQIQKENDRFTQKTTKTEVKKSRVRNFFDRMKGKQETPTDANS